MLELICEIQINDNIHHLFLSLYNVLDRTPRQLPSYRLAAS